MDLLNELLTDGNFWVGLLLGVACTAAIAALGAAAHMRLLRFHSVREWRTPVLIVGERFYIVPEQEYEHLDSIRAKVVAVTRLRAGGKARLADIPGRPDHDMTTRGDPLVPGR